MAIPVIMPRQGQSVETCIITQWIKKKGDQVKTGDVLFSYETDKASFDAEAEQSGELLEIFFSEGDEVPVLTNVAVIGKPGENAESFRPGSPSAAPAAAPATAPATAAAPAPSLRISPRARAMAAKMGVDPCNIPGTGPNGRIIVRDVESCLKIQAAGEVSKVSLPYTGDLQFEEKKISNVRRIIARAMHESLASSAQLTHHMSADVRKLLALRAQVKAGMEKGNTVNITLNDMVCFAVIRALQKFPEVNSHFLGESIRTFSKVHLGIAVDTPRGLMVPAIPNADDLSLKGLSARLQEAAQRCKKGNISPELLSSSAASFTVSNLGNYGVEMFTPIINLPQVAILGVNTIISRPADLGDGVFGFVPMMGLSLTYDHRAVDGGPATLFLREIKNQIETFSEQ